MLLQNAPIVPNGHFNAPRPGILSGRHDGNDVLLPYNAPVYAPEACVRLLVNRPHIAYRAVKGKYVQYQDPTIVYEGNRYMYLMSHLMSNISLPNTFPAGHIISYQNGLFPVHYAVYRKHTWVNVTHGQQYAIDPKSVAWDNVSMALDPYMPRMDAVGIARQILEGLHTSESEKRRWLEEGLDLDHFISVGKQRVESHYQNIINQKNKEIEALKKGINRTQVNRTIKAAETTVVEAKKL